MKHFVTQLGRHLAHALSVTTCLTRPRPISRLGPAHLFAAAAARWVPTDNQLPCPCTSPRSSSSRSGPLRPPRIDTAAPHKSPRLNVKRKGLARVRSARGWPPRVLRQSTPEVRCSPTTTRDPPQRPVRAPAARRSVSLSPCTPPEHMTSQRASDDPSLYLSWRQRRWRGQAAHDVTGGEGQVPVL